jgi:2-methylaconitate cis-trans-isomerase PrpF
MRRSIPCWIMRGGTSKAIFFNKHDLPPRGLERDQIISSIIVGKYGMDPTGMQLDGLGGGISSTSKVAIISKSSEQGVDLDYEFGQVGLKDGVIDWKGACGNISSAVLLYAKLNGWIQESVNSAVVLQVNNGMKLRITHTDELVQVPGIFGNSSAVHIELLDESAERNVLPTQNAMDQIDGIPCTLVHFANPCVIVNYSDVQSILSQEWVDHFRIQAAEKMGIELTEAFRIAFIEPPKAFQDSSGNHVQSSEMDFFARITTPSRLFHHALTSTGSANLAISALIPGTLTHQMISHANLGTEKIRIGTLAGVIDLYPRVLNPKHGIWIASVMMKRTCRALMQGFAPLP